MHPSASCISFATWEIFPACFLDANDILDILCKSYCGLRLDVTSGTGRYVVHDNRKAYGLCHCGIVSNQTLLGRLIVIRSYHKQSVRAVLFRFLRQIDCGFGAVRAGACDDRHALSDLRYGKADSLQMLLMAQCG